MHPRSQLIATSVAVALSSATLAGPTRALTTSDRVQDWRSPDAIDAATPPPRSQPSVQVTPPPAIARSRAGFNWDSAAIGAGGTIGLLAVSAGTGLALRRRHSDVPSRVAAE